MSTPRDPVAHAPALVAAAGSAVLSAAVLLRRPLFNNDGVPYLLAAEAFAREGFEAARAVHPWPFFSVLVAAAAAVLRVSAETAAHVTGAALLAAASAAFVCVAARLGATRRVQWLAAAVVLAHPWLNESRDHILRDFGVWAFGLLALRALLGLERPRAGDAARWAAFGSAAVLFRPDAAALLLAAPFALALRRDAAGRRVPVVLGLLAFALAMAALVVGFLMSEPALDLSSTPFRRAAAALAAAFPLPYGREYAPVLLATGLLALPVVKTLKTLGLVHSLFAAVGAVAARPAADFHRAALLATLAAAALPLYVQAGRLLFVESRYTVFATLVIALLAPFGAAAIAARGTRHALAVAAVLALTLGAGLPLREAPGAHVRDAAAWVSDHGGGGRLRTNSLQVAYLSRARVEWPLVRSATVHGPFDGAALAPGDLWAVRLGPADGALGRRLDTAPGFERRAAFTDEGGDAVRIYACIAPAGCRAGPGE